MKKYLSFYSIQCVE